jgi:alpha-tubulin suppressor-like RCC1 family protein
MPNGGEGGGGYRAWRALAAVGLTATAAAVLGVSLAGVDSTAPGSTEVAFNRAPQAHHFARRAGSTRGTGSTRGPAPASTSSSPREALAPGAGGLSARGGSPLTGGGSSGFSAPLGSPQTAALPALGGSASPGPAASGGVRYSPVPLPGEPTTACLPATRTRVECEEITAPAPSLLSSEALEGTGHLEGLTPQELRAAYKVPEHGGSSATIALVDGPADPNAEADLNVYRKEYGLGECTEANHCFKQMNALGEVKKPAEPGSWNIEIALDLDMVSAACPECHIVLVEAMEEGPTFTLAAEEEALRLPGITAVSDSWNIGFEKGNPANSKVVCTGEQAKRCLGAEEEETDDHIFNHPGTPIFVAGGDYGYAARYPAISPFVIAVGGTTLKKEPGTPRGWSEETWYNPNLEIDEKGRGGSSACSIFEAKPRWQTDRPCAKRMLSDVSADANESVSPPSVYDSYVPGGWANVGGTSASAPFVAGVWAVATSYSKNLNSLGAEAFYKDPSALFDVTRGINGTCTPPTEDEYWCTTETGYDGPTGNGSPNGVFQFSAAPSVTTGAASGLSSSTVTLNGSLNPNGLETTFQFQYGTTTSYGTNVPVPAASAGSGLSSVEVSRAIQGLAAHTTYHYRLVATNSSGTTNGADETFKTLTPPAVTVVQANAGPPAGGTTVNITGSNFTGATQVHFGAVAATNMVVDSSSLVTATAPQGNGTVDVTVTTSAGTSPSTSADHFTYRNGSVGASWGANKFGQLGNGTTTSTTLPVTVGGSGELAAVAAGYVHSLAIKNGSVLAVGNGEQGQLGNGTLINSTTPVAVCAIEEAACHNHLAEATAIAAGKSHSLALLKSGAVVAWGLNSSGQLGNGTNSVSDTPVRVSGVTEATAIAAGASFSLALLKNGTVVAWGLNSSGQLGNDKVENSNVPVPVCANAESPCTTEHLLNEVAAIAASGSHAVALLRNGTVMAWGEGKAGQLGNGKTENSSVPVKVSSLSGATAVAAGESDSLALLSNASVDSWGANEYGQLGNGATTPSSTPVKVSGISEATAIAAGTEHNVAQLTNGTLEAWGGNESGGLGDANEVGPESCTVREETKACSKLPVHVDNMNAVAQIAAGQADSLAIGTSPAPIVTKLEPSEGLQFQTSTVAITGSHFTGVSNVKFGSANATSFTMTSATTINAVAPAGNGTVAVTVIGPGGSSALTPVDLYSYLIPSLIEGLSFKTPIETGKQIKFAIPSEGKGFTLGPMKIVGSVGEAAKLTLESKPGSEEIETGEFRATGQGIVTTVEGFGATGEHVIGPVTITCTAPTPLIVAEIPIGALPVEALKQYSTTFNAECVNWPGGWNIPGTAKVTISGTAPEGVTVGEEVQLSNATFMVTMPQNWSEWLYVLGGRQARGTSTSKATSAALP